MSGVTSLVRRHAGPSLVLLALALAATAVSLFPRHADALGPPAVLVGYAATALMILRKVGNLEGRDRVAWRTVGLGFVAAATGIMVVGILDATIGAVPAFGPTDMFFIVSYGLILTGFGSLPHLSGNPVQRVRILLDSLIGALSIAAVMWVLVLGDLLNAFAAASAWDHWAGSAYPILDVAALMMVVIVVARRSVFRFDVRLLLFALGIIAQSFADLGFLSSGVGKTFGETNPNYPVFLLATGLYFSGALIVDRQPKARAYADRSASLWSMLAPYTTATGLLILLLVEIRSSELTVDARVALFATLIVGLLVILRQMVAIRENRHVVDRQRSELVSSISHELRTPLTAVVGFLELLADPESGLESGEREELTNVVHQQARYMSRIVSDLILLARDGAEELTLKETVVPMSEVVAKALDSVEKKAAMVMTEVEPDLQANIDAGRVQQILVNLVSNAVRYGHGRGLVVIRREGADLSIEVHDNGPGVPKKYELAIWEQFERGPNRFNASTPGSGIGLAVVDAITKAHHGTAEYRFSERLGGACFRVVLPHRVVAA